VSHHGKFKQQNESKAFPRYSMLDGNMTNKPITFIKESLPW